MELTSENKKPLLSIVIPAYNEEGVIESHLQTICDYMVSLENKCRWEIIIINDGSKDQTGKLADSFAKNHKNVRVIHHKVNLYLGSALRTGFKVSQGDYIIPLDIDLSYSVDHVGKLLDKIMETEAEVVVASPYMKGGKVSHVPFLRSFMSKVVNSFLRFIAREKIHTFTGMVRAYNSNFLRHLVLKARDNEINPEIIYKTILLRGRVEEIPAHLDWSAQKLVTNKRKSKIRVFRGVISGFMSGFIFRPYFFFIAVGLVLFLISLYIIIWILINTFALYPQIHISSTFIDDKFSYAIALLFRNKPHAFLIGGFVFVIAVQFLSLGFLSLQSKRYFEELFNLNTQLFKSEDSKN